MVRTVYLKKANIVYLGSDSNVFILICQNIACFSNTIHFSFLPKCLEPQLGNALAWSISLYLSIFSCVVSLIAWSTERSILKVTRVSQLSPYPYLSPIVYSTTSSCVVPACWVDRCEKRGTHFLLMCSMGPYWCSERPEFGVAVALAWHYLSLNCVCQDYNSITFTLLLLLLTHFHPLESQCAKRMR